MNLGTHANNILQMFDLPECLITLEDAANAFLKARKYYWQQLGMSSMDVKVVSTQISPSSRDYSLDSSLSDIFPAFVEFQPTDSTARRIPVDIIPLEDVIKHEGERALAIYNGKLRLAWDCWTEGSLYLFYDPSAEIANLTLDSSIDFPSQFLDMIEYKGAYDLAPLAKSREVREAYTEQRPPDTVFLSVLDDLKSSFAENVMRWEQEFKVWRFSANEERSYERRSDGQVRNYASENIFDNEIYY